jgi:hypothetical protein
MAVYKITETKKDPDNEGTYPWNRRVANLPDIEVLYDWGYEMKVRTGDEINLRMACGDVCRIQKL